MQKGRVAVVTGGGRGIGQAISRRLTACGTTVVVVTRSLGEEPRPFDTIQCDVGDEASVRNAFDAILDRHGRIDVLVNNAGVTHGSVVHRDSLGEWEDLLRVNLLGTFLCTRAVLPSMRAARSGAIVNVSSMAAHLGNLGQGAYAASKAGVEALTKTTAREGASHGIRVNAVRPGLIDTDMTSGLDAQVHERLLSSVPLRRAGRPEEVADVVEFLASDRSSYVTGVVVDVAGGRGM